MPLNAKPGIVLAWPGVSNGVEPGIIFGMDGQLNGDDQISTNDELMKYPPLVIYTLSALVPESLYVVLTLTLTR